jgi:putative transposase
LQTENLRAELAFVSARRQWYARRPRLLRTLRQAEGGMRVADICREHGISEATFYIWKKKYSGLGLSELRELRQLREENSKLKHLVADLSLDRHILQEIVQKKL